MLIKLCVQYFLVSHNLKIYIDFKTHLSSNTLDLFITRDYDSISFSIASGYYISDHCMIIPKIDIARPKPTYKKITYRKVKYINVDLFRQDILNLQFFSCNINHYSIEELCLSIDQSLSELLDRYAPLITKTVRDDNSSPWNTDDLHNLKCEKRRCEYKYRFSKNLPDLVSFKILRLKYIHQCNDAKKR